MTHPARQKEYWITNPNNNIVQDYKSHTTKRQKKLQITMKNLKYITFIMVVMMLSFSSCISKKGIEKCKIEKVLNVVVNNDNSYVMQVKFNNCVSRELRETLVKNELMNRYPLTKDKTISVEEYLGKLYNEYRYEIQVE